jgi:hypothetical protein
MNAIYTMNTVVLLDGTMEKIDSTDAANRNY